MLKNISLIIIIYIAAAIETDIYLPAFVDMMNFFKVTEEEIQYILIINFIGLLISSPIYGPVSDSFGRKKPLVASLILFLVGSIITVFTSDFNVMLFGRFLQGLGSGGCFTIGGAIVFDIFDNQKAIKVLNYLGAAIPIIMSFAPPVGGYLNYEFGFRSNFIAILILVLISVIITTIFFKESLNKEKRKEFNLKFIMNDFLILSKTKQFLKLQITLSLDWAGYTMFLSITSVLFVADFGLSKTYFPFVQLGFLIPYVAGCLSANTAIKHFGIDFIKKSSIFLIMIGGSLLILASIFYSRDPLILTASTIPISIGFAWYNSPYFIEIMSLFPNLKGASSSLLTSTRLLITAILVSIVSKYSINTIIPLTFVMTLICIALCALTISFERNKPLFR